MLTEESNSERQNTKQDEPPVGKIPENFAIAKFDYNAQKVVMRKIYKSNLCLGE